MSFNLNPLGNIPAYLPLTSQASTSTSNVETHLNETAVDAPPKQEIALSQTEAKPVQKIPFEMQKAIGFFQLTKIFTYLADKKLFDLSQEHIGPWNPEKAAAFNLKELKSWKVEELVQLVVMSITASSFKELALGVKTKNNSEADNLKLALQQPTSFKEIIELFKNTHLIFNALKTKQPFSMAFSLESGLVKHSAIWSDLASLLKLTDVFSLSLEEFKDQFAKLSDKFSLTQESQLDRSYLLTALSPIYQLLLNGFVATSTRLQKELKEFTDVYTKSLIVSIGEERQKDLLNLNKDIKQLFFPIEFIIKKFCKPLSYSLITANLSENNCNYQNFLWLRLEQYFHCLDKKLNSIILPSVDKLIDVGFLNFIENGSTSGQKLIILQNSLKLISEQFETYFLQAAEKIDGFIVYLLESNQATLDEVDFYNQKLFLIDLKFFFICLYKNTVGNKAIKDAVKQYVSSSKTRLKWHEEFLCYTLTILSDAFDQQYSSYCSIKKTTAKQVNIKEQPMLRSSYINGIVVEQLKEIEQDDAMIIEESAKKQSDSSICFYLTNYLCIFSQTLKGEHELEQLKGLLEADHLNNKPQGFLNQTRKAYYQELKEVVETLSYSYQTCLLNSAYLSRLAKPNLEAEDTTSSKDLDALWPELIDSEPIKKVSKKTPKTTPIAKISHIESDSEDDAAIIIEDQQLVDVANTKTNSIFIAPLKSYQISSYQDVLLADENIHAHHLLCTIELLQNMHFQKEHREILMTLAIQHLYHSCEQHLTRNSKYQFDLVHDLQRLYGKKQAALEWLNKASIDVRYPHSHLDWVCKHGHFPNLSLKVLTTSSLIDEDYDLLLKKMLETLDLLIKECSVQKSSQVKQDELKSFYSACKEGLNLVLKLSSSHVEMVSPLTTPTHLTKSLKVVQANLAEIEELFHNRSAQTTICLRQQDLLVHLKRMKDVADLLSYYPLQKYLSLFEGMFSLAAQYACELLGTIETELNGYSIYTHKLEEFIQILDWENTLGIATCQVLKELSRNKSIEYPFGDIYRHPKRKTANLEAFSKACELSWIARTSGEGFTSKSMKGEANMTKILNGMLKRWLLSIETIKALAIHVYKKLNANS